MKIGFCRCRLLPINKADDCVHSQISNYNFPIWRKITLFFSNTTDVTRKVDAKKASCSLAPRFRWKVPRHGNMNILNDEISVMLKKLSRVALTSQGLLSSSSSLLTLVDKLTNGQVIGHFIRKGERGIFLVRWIRKTDLTKDFVFVAHYSARSSNRIKYKIAWKQRGQDADFWWCVIPCNSCQSACHLRTETPERFGLFW